MSSPAPSGVTARQQFEELYRLLHSRARMLMRAKHHLDPTGPSSLVHDAFVRLQRTEGLVVNDDQHFVALASRVMRRIIIDRARALRTTDCNTEVRVSALEDVREVGLTRDPDELLSIDQSLERVAVHHPRAAQVAELLIFGGLKVAEAAALLGLSRRTVHRDLEFLRQELKDYR